MANEEIVAFSNADFSKAAPYEIWDKTLEASGFQNHVAPDAGNGNAVFKVDLGEDGININEEARKALIAAYSLTGYTDEGGMDTVKQFSKFRNADGNLVPLDVLINDPASIVELFVEVNPRGEVTPLVRVDNPSLETNPAISTYFSLGEAQVEAARKTVESARAEWENREYTSKDFKDLGIHTDAVFFPIGTPQEQQQVANHYKEIHQDAANRAAKDGVVARANAVLDRIASDIKTQHFDLDNVKEYYDKEHLAREVAWFERNARKKMEKLWADFEQNFPYEINTPETEAAKQAIRDRLEKICENTVIEFENICGDAYEKNGRVVDRNLLSTLREAGKSLLSKFKEVAKEFLDMAKDALTKEKFVVVRDDGTRLDISKKDFSTLKELSAQAREATPEERASALERLKAKIDELADNANNKIKTVGSSIREWVSEKIAAAKAKVQEGVQKFAENVEFAGEAMAEAAEAVVGVAVGAIEGAEKALRDRDLIKLDVKNIKGDFLTRATNNDGKKIFTKALGSNIIYNKEGYAKELQCVPQLNDNNLAQLATRVEDEIAEKPLSEWIKDPNVKVELLVGVPIDENGKPNGEKMSLTDYAKSVFVKDMPASIFITDLQGNDIGSVGVELTKEEMSDISRVVDKSHLGEKAVIIAEIADIVKNGSKYTKDNADKWVSKLKNLSLKELNTLADHLDAVAEVGNDPSKALKTKLDNIKGKDRE